MSDTQTVKALFLEALELPPEDRPALLDRRCSGDPSLRARVQELLEAYEGAGSFLEATDSMDDPAAGVVEGPGTRIGRYRLLQLIGEGGMGSVFLAEQTEPVTRRVALKIIKLGMDTRRVIARFEAERQALALMDHPNIAKVLDAGSTDTGRPYFVMELVNGEPITECCDKNNLTIRERLDLFTHVCHAVQHAHTKGIIHRDLKPGNVLVNVQDGRLHPKIIDFGIAKAIDRRLTDKTLFTELRQLIGTPEYMSPEQAEGSLDIDTRTDLYSLGVLLYELLTGVTPFDPRRLRSAAYAEIPRIIRDDEPTRPSTRLFESGEQLPGVAARRRVDPARLGAMLRGDLDCVVMKCLEKDRARRYQTAAGLAADVFRHVAGEPVSAVPPSAAYKLRKFARRHRAGVLAGFVIAVTLILGVVGTTIGMVWALRERDRAEAQATRAELAEEEQGRERQRAENALMGEAEERRRSEEQRELAERRATETEQVAGFLSRMLVGVEAEAMGRTIVLTLRDQARAGLERQWVGESPDRRARTPQEVELALLEFDEAVASGHPVDLARRMMDQHVLGPASDVLEEQFADQPLVQARIQVSIGEAYRALGLYDRAEPQLWAALDARERELGHDHADVAAALELLSRVLLAKGNYAEAEELQRDALEVHRKVLGDEHPSVATSLNNLADVLQSKDDFAAAEPLYREALALRRRLLGDEHVAVAQSLNNLAVLLKARGEYLAAEALYRESLALTRKLLGEEHLRVAAGLNNLAGLLQTKGDYAAAELLFRDALAMRRRLLGDEHPVVAGTLNNLAELLRAKGDDAGAEPLLREALALRRRVLGDRHPDVAQALNNLAALLRAQGRLAEAEPLLREALSIVRTLGECNRGTAAALNNLAVLLQAKGDLAGAEPLFREALAVHRELFGDRHPDVAHTLANLALLLEAQGDLAGAEPLLREALAIRRELLGPDHVELATSLADLGVALSSKGDYIEAEALLRESLAIRRKLLGDGHPRVIRTWTDLSAVLRRKGDPSAAAAELRTLLELQRVAQRPDDDVLATTLTELGAALVDAHAPAAAVEAELVLRECLAIRERMPEGDARGWKRHHVASLLGGALLDQDRFAEADPLLVQAAEGMAAELPSPPLSGVDLVAEAIERVVSLYASWDTVEPSGGHAAQAAEWRARLQDRREGRPGSDQPPR